MRQGAQGLAGRGSPVWRVAAQRECAPWNHPAPVRFLLSTRHTKCELFVISRILEKIPE